MNGKREGRTKERTATEVANPMGINGLLGLVLAAWDIRSQKTMKFANGCPMQPAQGMTFPSLYTLRNESNELLFGLIWMKEEE